MRRFLPPLALIVVALVVRGLFLFNIEAYPKAELIRNRLDDQVVFDLWARSAIEGRELDLGAIGHESTYWAEKSPGVYPRAPLYPWFLAAIYRVAGVRHDLVRVVQMVLGALSVGLVYWLGLVLWDRRAGVAAGAILAFYGPLVFYEATLLRAAVYGPLVAVLLCALVHAGRVSDSRGRWGWGALAGAALGAGTLLRANFALPAIAAIAWLAWRARETGERAVGARGSLRRWAAPVVVRNSVRHGAPAFISSNGPYVLFTGNVHDADGLVPARTPAYQAVKASGSREEVDLVRETLADIHRYPGTWVSLMARKSVFFFAPHEIPNNLSYAMAKKTNPWLAAAPIEFWALLPPALAGLILGWRRRRELAPLYLVLGAYFIATVLFHVPARVRLAAVIPLALFAGAAISFWWERLGRRQWIVAGTWLAAALLAAAALRPSDRHREADFQMAAAAYFSRGQQLEQGGRPEEARRFYGKAVSLNPDHGEALGRALALGPPFLDPAAREAGARAEALCEEARRELERGNEPAALDLLREARHAAPGHPVPHRYLSNVHYLAGDKALALEHLERAVELAPEQELPRLNLARLRRELAAERAQAR